MRKESGELLHLHLLATGGTEPERLEMDGCEDEGLIVPVPDGVRHRRIPLGEEVLELVHLEHVSDRLVAAVLGVVRTLPTLQALLLPSHRPRQDLLLLSVGSVNLLLACVSDRRQARHRQAKDDQNSSIDLHFPLQLNIKGLFRFQSESKNFGLNHVDTVIILTKSQT